MDFAAKRFIVKIATKEDCFDGLAQFRERFAGRVPNIVAGKAAQDRFGFGGAKAQCRSVFGHLVVLLTNQSPVDRPGQHQLQIRVRVRRTHFRSIKCLGMNRFEPRQELETEEPAKREGDRALAVGIDVLSVDLHFGAVANNALNHRGYFRRGG
jgi:hypothetical protein